MNTASALILCLTAGAMMAAAPQPPLAKKDPKITTLHGDTRVDEFHWLRDKSNPAVIAHLEAENAYADGALKPLEPFRDALYKEIVGRIKQTDMQVPYRLGGYWYYSRTEEGKQYPILCRKKGKLEAAEEITLDLNELAKGHSFLSLGAYRISDDGNLLAYSTDTTGFRQYALHVKDLRTGQILSDTAERVTSVIWASDGKMLFYCTEDAVTKRSNQLHRQVLGSGKGELLFEEKDEQFGIHLGRSRDRKYLVLESRATDTTEVRYLAADQPQGEFRTLLPREKGHKYDLDHREGLFYIRTNKGAKNYRMVTAKASDPAPEHWKEFLPHRPDALLQGIDLFQNHGVVIEQFQGLQRMRILDFKRGAWHPVAFPEPVYSAFGAENPEYETQTFRFNYQSMVTPSSVFEMDLGSHKQTLLKRQEVLGGFDPKHYVSERLWATAKDGTQIPLSVVYRKGLKKDGKAPLLLYGYGSYGYGMPANFSSGRLSLLDRGMVYVVAHIRGGNEMGEAWHDDGMLMKKKNSFTDFIDSAEYLLQRKWTSKDRLVIQGGSAGGLLMGAVTNLRPDLFKAVLSHVPFVDVMNTMLDASLPLTVGEYLEWGNPKEKAAYEYMKSYSPYDNLEKKAYPAMLVKTSLNDSQVMYWEPAKYVARLRGLKTDKTPLLLKCNMGAGHGGASGRYDAMKEAAYDYAFLLSQVGITK